MDSETPTSDCSKAIQILLQGHTVATRFKSTFNSRSPVTDDQSSMVDQILNSFSSSIALLEGLSDGPGEVSQFPGRTLVGSPDSGESIRSSGSLKEKRGCYKRRKTAHSWKQDTVDLVDDGHQWRKYGQKSILNAQFPRNYFRCTHKFDQHCPATKQVQRISKDPPLYRTTYYAHHKCRNLLKASQFTLDTATDPSDSSYLISFATAANPSTCKQESSSFFLKSCFQSSPTVKKECSSKIESDDGRLTSNNDQSLSSDYLLSHEFDYGDVISSYTNSGSNHDDDLDDHIRSFMACGDFERDGLNDFI